jgi:uncharacterized glyoxalase superfamily protein PhnB
MASINRPIGDTYHREASYGVAQCGLVIAQARRDVIMSTAEPPSACSSFAEPVARDRLHAARGAGELDLFVPFQHLDGTDAHGPVAAATLWKKHTRIGGNRLSLHVPSQQRFFYHSDVDALHGSVIAAGYRPDTAPRNAEWGERFFHLTDPDTSWASLGRCGSRREPNVRQGDRQPRLVQRQGRGLLLTDAVAFACRCERPPTSLRSTCA